MRIRRKFMVIGILAVVLLAGISGGIALADTDEDGNPVNSVIERVAIILNDNGVEVTADQIQEAFDQARDEMKANAEANRQERLETMLEEGKITQEQYDRIRERVENRPEMPRHGFIGRFGGRGFFGGHRSGGGDCPAPADQS